MKRALIGFGGILLLWLLAWAIASQLEPAPAHRADMPTMAAGLPVAVAIAARHEALTLARFERDGALRVLLVSGFENDQVTGIDLHDRFPSLAPDPIAVFNALGYEVLLELSGPEIQVPSRALRVPFEGTAAQVAAGINYPEHGNEVGVDESFLFPKLARPGQFMASVAVGNALLDYELELGFVALTPLRADELPRHVGLVLASDYTDRALLMRHIEIGNIASGRGFTLAKSLPDFMPVGPLLVVPKQIDSFYKSLKLQLWVNGQLRQVAEPRLMAWDWPRILRETFARQAMSWPVGDKTASLPVEQGVVPAGTVFLSGTPEGVVFRSPSARQIFLGISERVFTLRWFDPAALVEPLIRESRLRRDYLQAGDTVVMHADRLGVIRNTVVASAPQRSP